MPSKTTVYSLLRNEGSLEGDTVALHSNLFFSMGWCSELKEIEILFKKEVF